MWSRLQELEDLKMQLRELSVAIVRVESIRKTLEEIVDINLEIARSVASQTYPNNDEVRYSTTFSIFFSRPHRLLVVT